MWLEFNTADEVHWLSADVALLSLVLLFRAQKDLVTWWQNDEPDKRLERGYRLKVSGWWAAVCLLVLVLGTAATRYSWPLPLSESWIHTIQSQVTEPERPAH